MQAENVSAYAKLRRYTEIALPYVGYFLIAAAAVGALVLMHQAFLPILCVAGAFVLLPTISLICRGISYLSKKNIQQEVVDAQMEHLKVAFDCVLRDRTFMPAQSSTEITGERLTEEYVYKELIGEGVSETRSKDFSQKVIQLRNEVLALTREGADVRSVKRMYSKFQALAQNKLFRQVYKQIKDKDLACVNFLKILAMKFRTAPVGEIIGGYASENMPKARGRYTPAELGNVTHRHQGRIFGFKRSKPHQAAFWVYAYPDRFAGSVTSNRTPQLYNNMEANNAASFMELECHGVPVSIVAQPTLAIDPVFELIGADAADQIVVNLLDNCKSFEARWIQDLDSSTEETRTDHMLFGFATKKKGSLMAANSVPALLNDYRTAIKSGGRSVDGCTKVGTYVSSDLLTDTEIDESFKQAVALLPSNIKLNTRKKQAILALADAMLIFKRIVKKTKGMSGSPDIDRNMRGLTVSIGCKQCQDRGPILMEAVMLLLKAYESKGRELTRDEFYQIASVVLRAEINDGRLQLQEKAEVLEELFTLMGRDIGRISSCTQALALDSGSTQPSHKV